MSVWLGKDLSFHGAEFTLYPVGNRHSSEVVTIKGVSAAGLSVLRSTPCLLPPLKCNLVGCLLQAPMPGACQQSVANARSW